MPTPTARLEARRQLMQCRVCAWLATLKPAQRREWQKAIMDPRFGAEMVASEIMLESGDSLPEPIGESSVSTHRRGAHS